MTTDKPVLFVRVKPDVALATKKAAADDQRSVSVFVERLLAEWLRANGYLPTPKKKR